VTAPTRYCRRCREMARPGHNVMRDRGTGKVGTAIDSLLTSSHDFAARDLCWTGTWIQRHDRPSLTPGESRTLGN